jgi:hypothetical protein
MLASYRIYLEEGGPAAFVDIEQNGSDFIVSGRGIAPSFSCGLRVLQPVKPASYGRREPSRLRPNLNNKLGTVR